MKLEKYALIAEIVNSFAIVQRRIKQNDFMELWEGL